MDGPNRARATRRKSITRKEIDYEHKYRLLRRNRHDGM